MPCRVHLGEVEGHYEEIRQLGGDVLVVSFAPPARVAAYLARYPLPFPVVSDPSREAYRAFDLGRTSWSAMLRPGFILRYLRTLFRGRLPRRPEPDEDVLQLGGDFVLGPDRRLVYGYRSTDPADRPAVSDLLNAVRAAGSRPVSGP